MPIMMKAKANHVYAGRRRKPGDVFPAAGRSDARLLVNLGRADIIASDVPAIEAPPPAPPVPETFSAPVVPEAEPPAPITEPDTPEPQEAGYVSRETEPEPDTLPSESEPPEPQERPKRAYRRRDMVAEGNRN